MHLNSGNTEVTVNLGGQERVLKFNNAHRITLSKLLDTAPLDFLRDGGDLVQFVVMAVFAGMATEAARTRAVSPNTVSEWLDDARKDAAFDVEELAVRILYAITNGETGRMRERNLKVIAQLAQSLGLGGTEADPTHPPA